ncbi:MAG: recombination protein RecR, partial [Rhodospirillaceae bacterium]|nr:recombination protein RecR [Rhodospirillaceae bacterium]
MLGPQIEILIRQLSKLPGLGPRSARRAALSLIKQRETRILPLINALEGVLQSVRVCSVCGNFDTHELCQLCTDLERDQSLICVVEDVADLWALERSGTYRGLYHVIGGLLSPLDGIGPDDLNIKHLLPRATAKSVKEIVFALSSTVDGQTTAHYLSDHLKECDLVITFLAQGVPVGGELDYL